MEIETRGLGAGSYPEPPEYDDESKNGHVEYDYETHSGYYVSDEKEVIGYCPLCGMEIYEDDEIENDNSNSYGGDCHAECFYEAEESRLN
ncbi:MAG: hypothetical protein IJ690_02040 [Clostridia bacterium]|nr:hypothetical protein [Clostridia bacterium]MBR1653722.1 hypothetical protein [Clostridia bacterium]